MNKYLLLSIIMILTSCIVASATIIRIPINYSTIQAGIDAAGADDTVLVSPGTYAENIDFSGKIITVGSLYLTTSDPAYISSTIIDGGGGGSVVTFSNSETSLAQLIGFTIQNGSSTYGGGIHCDGASPTISYNRITGNTTAISGAGAGIACRNMANPSISFNTIYDNSSPSANGGGIYCWNMSMPTIDRNTITGNSSNYAGGIFSNNAMPMVTNTILWDNSASIGNDEIYVNGPASPAFNYCDIQGGWTGTGNIDCDPEFCDALSDNYYLTTGSCCFGEGDGGVNIGAFGRGCGANITINVPVDYSTIQTAIDASMDGDTVLVQPGNYGENISFDGKNIVLASLFLTTGDSLYIGQTIIDGLYGANEAIVSFTDGEDSSAVITGFFILDGYGGIKCINSNPTIRYNYIYQNLGGIICDGSDPIIEFNKITENWADNNGGGISCSNSNPIIRQNRLWENHAGLYGGGIYVGNESWPQIENNEITGNASVIGGGIYCDSSSATINSSTIAENMATDIGGGVYINSASDQITIENTIIWFNTAGTEGDVIYIDDIDSLDITYSDIQGDWAGVGNIDCDPMFCPDSNNFYINISSCCVGAGEGGVDIGAYGTGCRSPRIVNVPDEYGTIQAAIDASIEGDTVLAQPGTYVENINFNGQNIIVSSLHLTTGDTSYISSTIIDGDSAGTVVTFENGEDSTTAITGFTIQNGSNEYGGGINCTNSSNPTISNNSISGNYSANYGGGIRCGLNSNPSISSNTINGNYCGISGGGINCWNSNPIINDNTISANTSGTGGGIVCNSSEPTISNNTISGNNSLGYGGGIVCYDSDPAISNNIISGNESGFWGGGILCDNSDPTISHNTISGNSSLISGGGIYSASSNPTISENTIIANSATTDTSKGGGIYVYWGDPVINSNTIIGNSAAEGGGIHCYYISSPTISNNTISANSASLGGGFYCRHEQSLPNFDNTILWANSATTEGDEIYIETGSPVFSYCDIQDTLWPGNSNISCDPMFCDPDNGDFRLTDISCCIGAGQGGTDIGAYGASCVVGYEYLPGDANMYNGAWPPSVIGGDVTYLVNYFRSLPSSQPCLLEGFWCSADANGDCLVIGSDVTKLVTYFRGMTELSYCHDLEPMWPTPDDLPIEAPSGWPNCE
ncbi:MAG: DUF1565 domain-containing protein [candidate division Zixibacteria bacterium]|nr:DUF1565 domain-containing protein [candidate division Zixibacteria bacterium]